MFFITTHVQASPATPPSEGYADRRGVVNTLILNTLEKLRGMKLRSRGFAPKLTDADLITMEIVGHLAHDLYVV